MLKLIIGNKAYSSWSLRGWLAVKQSGLPFEEMVVPLYDQDWDQRRQGDEFVIGQGPILWDEQAVIGSLASAMARRHDRPRANVRDETRTALRSMAAVHLLPELRRELSSTCASSSAASSPRGARRVVRILELWAQARARHGGAAPTLGTFGAVDIMSRGVTRVVNYSVRCRASPQLTWRRDQQP